MHHIDFNTQFESALRTILSEVPFLRLRESLLSPLKASGPDLVLKLDAARTPWTLVCEFKQTTQLRHVRSAIYQLHHFLNSTSGKHKYPILVGPYISPEAADLLRSESMGFADLAGNCFLSFDKVHIERSGARNPFAFVRQQRSVFAPKSTRVLITLLQHPHRAWQTKELAAAADVSPGHVSNIKKALIDREWAVVDAACLRISRPDAVLDAWCAAYEKRTTKRSTYYTPLHGQTLEKAVKAALELADAGTHAILSSFSAARWIAPFARVSTTHFYADAKGESFLHEKLELESVPRGDNVVIEVPTDEGMFSSRIEVAPGMWATNPIQTYLDLSASGERGAEAAEHLRSTKIAPAWKQPA